jgi:cob(I)alamin adenosyltransferase
MQRVHQGAWHPDEPGYAVAVRLDRIYTRAGDGGETSLGDGERVSKDSPRIWAYGTVDELGAVLGMALVSGLEAEAAELVRRVQNDLFDVGADLSVPLDTERGHGKSRLRIDERHVAALEQACDSYGERLAPLTSFVLSGGTPQAAALHLARTVCRRAERFTVRLAASEPVNPHAVAYLNRLSDLLFILARVHNDGGRADVLWEPGRSLAGD